MTEVKTGTIYKISTEKSDKVYVGSTTQPLNRRFTKHKSDFKVNRCECTSRELFELGECKIEALEVLYNCTKRELVIKEQEYQDLLKKFLVNKNKVNPTKKDKKEQLKKAALRCYHKKAQDPEFRKKKAEEARNRRLLKKSNSEAV
jgi:hypothetical protein